MSLGMPGYSVESGPPNIRTSASAGLAGKLQRSFDLMCAYIEGAATSTGLPCREDANFGWALDAPLAMPEGLQPTQVRPAGMRWLRTAS
jgi:hypothetical protein